MSSREVLTVCVGSRELEDLGPLEWAQVLPSQGSLQSSRELTDEFLGFLNFLKILCKSLNSVYFENSGVSFRS